MQCQKLGVPPLHTEELGHRRGLQLVDVVGPVVADAAVVRLEEIKSDQPEKNSTNTSVSHFFPASFGWRGGVPVRPAVRVINVQIARDEHMQKHDHARDRDPDGAPAVIDSVCVSTAASAFLAFSNYPFIFAPLPDVDKVGKKPGVPTHNPARKAELCQATFSITSCRAGRNNYVCFRIWLVSRLRTSVSVIKP